MKSNQQNLTMLLGGLVAALVLAFVVYRVMGAFNERDDQLTTLEGELSQKEKTIRQGEQAVRNPRGHHDQDGTAGGGVEMPERAAGRGLPLAFGRLTVAGPALYLATKEVLSQLIGEAPILQRTAELSLVCKGRRLAVAVGHRSARLMSRTSSMREVGSRQGHGGVGRADQVRTTRVARSRGVACLVA